MRLWRWFTKASCARCAKSTVSQPAFARLWARWGAEIAPRWIGPPATKRCLSDGVYCEGGGVVGAAGAGVLGEFPGLELNGLDVDPDALPPNGPFWFCCICCCTCCCWFTAAAPIAVLSFFKS